MIGSSLFAKLRSGVTAIANLPMLRHPRVRKILWWSMLILIALLVVWLTIVAWGHLQQRIQQLILLLLVIVGVLLWFKKGLPWLDRRQSLVNPRGDLVAGNPQDEAGPRAVMKQALAEAKRVLTRSPEIERKGNPLYSVPWFLFLGDAKAEATGVLRIASATSPFAAPTRDAADNQFWHWWFFKSMIAIETDPRFVCDSEDKVTRGIWYQALQLLGAERSGLPLNGIVLLVSAEKLLGPPDELRRYMLNLRRLVDECMEHLQVVPPIYLLVSGCEKMPGFPHFTKTLPSEVLGQVLGYRFDINDPTKLPLSHDVGGIFRTLRERMHGILLSGIRHEPHPVKRKGIWDFVAGFFALETGLTVAVKLLLEDNPFQRTPQLRGLYFVGAADKGAFVDDLFGRFLPVDQPLALRMKQPAIRRWLGSLASIAVVGMLSALIASQVANAIDDNNRLGELVKGACGELATAEGRLHQMAACAKDISHIENLEHETGLMWGLQRYEGVLAEKKRLLVSEFKQIFNQHEARMARDLDSGSVLLDHFLAAAQRLILADRCLGAGAECRRLADEPNLLFDSASPIFEAVDSFTPHHTSRRQDTADSLLELYLAYLRWGREVETNQDPSLTETEQAQTYLAKLLERREFDAKDVVEWARTRHDAITGDRLWQLPASGATSKLNLPSVDAAYTHYVWATILREPIAKVATTLRNPKALLEFQQRYFAAYLAAWHDFLANFQNGIHAIGRDNSVTLLAAASHSQSPYNKVRSAVRDNLLALPLSIGVGARSQLLWGQIKEDWAGSLGFTWRFCKNSYGQLADHNYVVPPVWLLALNQTLETGWRDADARLMPFWSMLDSDPNGVKSLQFLREIYNSNGEKPSDFAAIKQIVETRPKQYESEFKGEDIPAWASLGGEVRMLLALAGYRAGLNIDTEWNTHAVPAVKKDAQVDAGAALRNGVKRFSEGTLAGFVNASDGRLKEVMGISLPLSRQFQGYLGDQGKLEPVVNDGKAIRIGMVELMQPSTFGMTREGDAGTTFELDCGGNKSSVTSKGASRTERQLNIIAIPETCVNARIKVALPNYFDDEQAQSGGAPTTSTAAMLTKTYVDDLFKSLAEDFKNGAKTFTMVDFKSSYSTEEWQALVEHLKKLGINQVRVFATIGWSKDIESRFVAKPKIESLPVSVIE